MKNALNLNNVAFLRGDWHGKMASDFANIAHGAAYMINQIIEDIAADPIRREIIGTGFHINHLLLY